MITASCSHAFDFVVQHDDGQVQLGQCLADAGRHRIGDHHRQAVEQAHVGRWPRARFPHLRPATPTKEQVVTHFAGLQIRTANNLRIKLAVQVRQHQTDDAALAEHQPAGKRVRTIRSSRIAASTRSQVSSLTTAAVDHPRDGANRDVC